MAKPIRTSLLSLRSILLSVSPLALITRSEALTQLADEIASIVPGDTYARALFQAINGTALAAPPSPMNGLSPSFAGYDAADPLCWWSATGCFDVRSLHLAVESVALTLRPDQHPEFAYRRSLLRYAAYHEPCVRYHIQNDR